MRGKYLATLVATWFLFPATPLAADPLADIERLVEPILQGRPAETPELLLPRAQALYQELATWRLQHADDIDAVVALARITWLLDRLEPLLAGRDAAGTAGSAQASRRNAYARTELDRLQRLLVRDRSRTGNERATLWYWQAQLWASPVVREIAGHWAARPIDLSRAIAAAESALVNAPSARFRDTLAQLLSDAYRDNEARDVLARHDGTGTHLQQLLADLRAVPLPAEAQLLDEDSRRFAEEQFARGRIADAPYVRARVYLLPMTSRQYETLARATWPTFRLLARQQADGAGPTWRSHAVQMLLLGGGPPRPIADLQQLEVAAMDGIALTLIELHDPPKAQRQRSPAGVALPGTLPGTWAYLYVLNDRTLH